MSSNNRITRAAVELVCNLCPCDDAMELFSPETPQSLNRLNILVALADSEDEGVRCAAGGGVGVAHPLRQYRAGHRQPGAWTGDRPEHVLRQQRGHPLPRHLHAGEDAERGKRGGKAGPRQSQGSERGCNPHRVREEDKQARDIGNWSVQSLQLLMMEEGQ